MTLLDDARRNNARGKRSEPSPNGRRDKSEAAPPGARNTPRRLDTYRPPPLDALPPPLDTYVIQAATALGCDPAFVLLPVLSVVAAMIGNSRVIQLKRGWREPSVVWSVVVADSGTLKTPGYLLGVHPVFQMQRRLRDEYRRQCAEHQNAVEAYRIKKDAAKKDGTDPGKPPEEPVERRVVCSDTTIEKLGELLQRNPRGLLVARDELAGWFSSFMRYKGKAGGSDLPNWLEMFRAGTVIIDRKTAEPKTLFVPQAAVSICGTIQPGVLAKHLSPECLDAGLGARLLMAMPTKLPKQWRDLEIDPATEGAYRTLLDALFALPLEKDRQGEMGPFPMKLSPEAKVVWVKFYDRWAQEQAAADGEIAAALAKLEAYAARFALIHHIVSRVYRGEDDRREIGPESIAAGVKLCRWFATEARRIYAMLGESEEERDTRRLVDFVQGRRGRITARDLQRSNSRKYPDVDAAEAALDALADSGAAQWIDGETPPRGGHRPRFLTLCPTHDTSDTRLANDDADEGHPSDTCADARSETCVFQAKNERVSEVSCVGQGKGETTSGAPPERVSEASVGKDERDISEAGGTVPDLRQLFPTVDDSAGPYRRGL